MIATCILLFAAVGGIEVTVAPDQPFPLVYTDDPLILEIISDVDSTLSGILSLELASQKKKYDIDLGTFSVHKNAPHWLAVREAPSLRGLYRGELTIKRGEEVIQRPIRFCRLDRLPNLLRLPFHVQCSGELNAYSLPAVQYIGLDTVRANVPGPFVMELVEKAASLNMHLVLEVETADIERILENIQPLLAEHCEDILRWEVDGMGKPESFAQVFDAFRQAGCPAAISPLVNSADAFDAFLAANPDKPIRHITLAGPVWPEPSEIERMQRIAEQYGQERWQVHVLCHQWRPSPNDPAFTLVRRFLQYYAAGAAGIGINASLIADDLGPQEIMSYLNGLALRFRGYEYVGNALNDPNLESLVFRSGADWLIALWANKENQECILPLDGVFRPLLTDALGNPVTDYDLTVANPKITVGAAPLYLTGTGGTILGKAATARAVSIARSVLAQSEWIQHLPSGSDLIQGIEKEPSGAGSRYRYLELLRAIPRIEQNWHSGQTPRHIAVPLISRLALLARMLCMVEEERGEHFLEPLSDTLARTEDLQALYLTGSGGNIATRERADWLLNEVRRLIEEVELLVKSDRRIEAGALAALAEWRAHCLDFAAKADPHREQAPVRLHVPVPSPEIPSTPVTPAAVSAVSEPPAEGPAPADGTVKHDTTFETIEHVVAPGDNPWAIARKYGVSLDDFLSWNNLTRKSILRVGEKYIIRK